MKSLRVELGWDISAADKRLLAFVREDLALPDGSTIATMTAACERLGLRAFDATEIVSLSSEVQRLAEAVAARAGDEEQHGVFLSHYQANAGPDVMDLKGQLEQQHASLRGQIWYDKDNDPSVEQMRLGVRANRFFLLFLTEDVLCRPFCRKEIRWALHYGKMVVLLWKQEGRGADTAGCHGQSQGSAALVLGNGGKRTQ